MWIDPKSIILAIIGIIRPARPMDVENGLAAGLLHPPPRDPEGPAPAEDEHPSDLDEEIVQPPWSEEWIYNVIANFYVEGHDLDRYMVQRIADHDDRNDPRAFEAGGSIYEAVMEEVAVSYHSVCQGIATGMRRMANPSQTE